MMDHDLGTIPDRVTLTPAERALLAEQGQGLMAELNIFLTAVTEGTAGDAIRSYRKVHHHHEYAVDILNRKIGHLVEQDHEEGRDH